ncbi:MAG: respiratory nitrate reductase subunit gamma [Gallionellaceae bacterium]
MFAILFYLATLVFVVGLIHRIRTYASTPAPLKIPTTPAPTTQAGVVLRMAREVVFFESLFKANLWTWGAGWLFHASLALVTMRHLRYFTDPVWGWVELIQPFGMYAGITMLLGVMGLWARRIFVERIRYISTPSDHLMLLLFVAIAGSGLLMKFVSHTDVIAVKGFFQGWMHFSVQPLPADALLFLHLAAVALLLLIFPISKLLHAPGIFFSPSRNQTDNPREKRHISNWAQSQEIGK